MSIKGQIAQFHHPLNLFKLIVQSIAPPQPGPLTFTKISGISQEIDAVEMPDRTRHSGGQTKPGTFTAMMPSHHLLENVFMELWFRGCQESVDRDYKKDATLVMVPVGLNPNARG